MKLHKGDQVLIISGKDRKKKGKIIEAFPRENRILVEGVNLLKKHQKAKRSGEKGQIVLKPAHISVANVKLLCPKCGEAVRVGYKIVENKKYRICRKCKQEI